MSLPKPIEGPLTVQPEQTNHGATLCLVDEHGRIIARSPDLGTYERATKGYGPTFERLAQCWNTMHELRAHLESGDRDLFVGVLRLMADAGFPVRP